MTVAILPLLLWMLLSLFHCCVHHSHIYCCGSCSPSFIVMAVTVTLLLQSLCCFDCYSPFSASASSTDVATDLPLSLLFLILSFFLLLCLLLPLLMLCSLFSLIYCRCGCFPFSNSVTVGVNPLLLVLWRLLVYCCPCYWPSSSVVAVAVSPLLP